MPTTSFTCTSRRGFTPSQNWTNGTCYQGFLNSGRCGGEITFNFSALDVSNIDITSIKMTVTVGSAGGSYTKYLYLHTGSYNGTSVGNYSFSSFYNTTKSKVFSASSNAAGFNVLKAYIEGGGTKLGIYNGGSSRGSASGKSYDYDYLSLTSMSLEITYEYKRSSGSISAAQTGSNATLAITAYNSAYSHKATWRLGSWTETDTVNAGVASVSRQIPHSALPDAESGEATVTLETLNGSTSLGSNTYTFPVTVPASVVPTIGSLTVTPVNAGSTAPESWSLYIQNKARAAAAISNAAAGAGASGITAYSIATSPNFGSAAASSLTTELLSAAGTVTFTATVTDSRGRTATATASITVQAYAAPVFTATPSAYRCDSNGTRNDTGGKYARLTASFAFSSIKAGSTEKNSLTVKRVTLNGVNTNLTSGSAVTIGANALSTDSSYDAVITLTDAVGSTTTYTVTIPSAKYVLHVRKGGRSVGIFRAAGTTDDDTLHVGGTMKLYNALTVASSSVGDGICANIGAVKKSGDTMAGWLGFDTSDPAKEFGLVFSVPNGKSFQIYPANDGSYLFFTHAENGYWNDIMGLRLSDDSLCVKILNVTNSLYVSNPTQARQSLEAALGTYTPGTRLDTGCNWNGKRVYRYCLTGTLTGTTTGDINIGTLPDTPTMIVGITGSYKADSGTNPGYWRPIGFTSYYNLSTANPHVFTAFVKADNKINLVIGSGLTGNKTYCVNIDYCID